MAQRTYTYTAQDYRDVFNGGSKGHVGVDPDGDLVWARHSDIVWAYETVVLDHFKLADYQPDDVVYTPSAMMKEEFDARNGIHAES